eukprot:GHVR01128865.1.p1 GENE.GHVR01128865.1~~GHVR01128865.1.p1  ORF type:complete len:113 (-),score=0.49 GHVR01128865.1:597-935(-)
MKRQVKHNHSFGLSFRFPSKYSSANQNSKLAFKLNNFDLLKFQFISMSNQDNVKRSIMNSTMKMETEKVHMMSYMIRCIKWLIFILKPLILLTLRDHQRHKVKKRKLVSEIN